MLARLKNKLWWFRPKNKKHEITQKATFVISRPPSARISAYHNNFCHWDSARIIQLSIQHQQSSSAEGALSTWITLSITTKAWTPIWMSTWANTRTKHRWSQIIMPVSASIIYLTIHPVILSKTVRLECFREDLRKRSLKGFVEKTFLPVGSAQEIGNMMLHL